MGQAMGVALRGLDERGRLRVVKLLRFRTALHTMKLSVENSFG